MVKYAEIMLEYGGKVYVSRLDYKVLNKLPAGVIDVTLDIGIDKGEHKVSNQPEDVGYKFFHLKGILIQQFPISLSFSTSPQFIDPYFSQQLHFTFKISLEDLKLIESQRSNDIELTINVEGDYLPHRLGQSNYLIPPSSQEIYMFNLVVPWKFSQKQWVDFLSAIGYNEIWIIEIPRPKLEGFHEIIEYLTKAQEALFNKSNPENVLTYLRNARDAFKPFFTQKESEINEMIDSESLGEKNFRFKSERIKNIYDNIGDFLNMGAHFDKYKVTYEDAKLAFISFVSILSYYSSILSKIEEKKKT